MLGIIFQQFNHCVDVKGVLKQSMKKTFFLEFSRNKTLFAFFAYAFLWIFFIAIIKAINFITVIVFLLLLFLACYFKSQDAFAGLYIHNSTIVYKRVFLCKKIDINSVDCIRVEPEHIPSPMSSKKLKDENGNILFRMRFYHNYYEKDQMDGYDTIEEIKRFFIERQICHCVYDKEALDYILTLNPNIKVVYYDEK